MKKIKVLRIIARLNIGGPAIHAILLTAGLNKDIFETLLLSGSVSAAEGDISYYAKEKQVEPVYIAQLKRELSLLADIAALYKIYRIISKEKPDIIHTHTAKAGTLGRLAGGIYNIFHPRGEKIRLFHTFHGHIFSGYFTAPKIKLFMLIERFIACFTDALVTVSESVKSELVLFKISRAEKIRVIPLGFELDRFLAVPAREEAEINIGIVGRLTAVKNHILFLQSAQELLKAHPQSSFNFKIVGDGELRKNLEVLVKNMGIVKYVEFTGWQKDLARVYELLDIVVITSINEGTPVSLIEAMASGRPVVAADVGGVRDLLGKCLSDKEDGFKICENGIIVKNHDSAFFSQALIRLIEDKQLRKDMGEAARDFTKLIFNKERLCRDIESLYFEQLGRRA